MHPRAKATYIAELIETNARNVKRHICTRCGTACYRGDDHDRVAHQATVDEVAIGPVEEMLRILEGRSTYDLVASAGAARLYRREDWHVHSNRPQKWPILMEHVCP